MPKLLNEDYTVTCLDYVLCTKGAKTYLKEDWLAQ